MQTESRIKKIQDMMQESDTDLVAIGPTTSMRYLLGFAPHADERTCLLLIDRQSVRMVVPDLNKEEVASHTSLENLIGWSDAEGPFDALQKALSGMPAMRKIAVDGAMRADYLLKLQSVVRAEQTVDAAELITPLRECKSADEIEALARSAAQADLAMQAAMDACRPGATEAEVAWATEAAFRQDGAEEVCFTLIASGPNGAYPHHHSGERKLQTGDAIIIDIGASLNGYKSDITRMVHLGKPSAEFLNAYNAVLAANQNAMKAVKPGATAEEIDNCARATLTEAGYGDYFTHRTGHGLGLDSHEPPWILAGNKTVLKEGMVFSIEPGAYLEGKFGIRIEDIVVVTASGVRNLSGFDHALVVKE